jgi:hypothetical protein
MHHMTKDIALKNVALLTAAILALAGALARVEAGTAYRGNIPTW